MPMRRRIKKPQNPSRLREVLLELLYYALLLLVFFAVVFYRGRKTEGPRMLGGFSAFIVLSGSMEEEIPKGSLVLTRQVDARSLRVGDDITYMMDPVTSITHRIVAIEENYEDTGKRAFQTQGIMNAMPDESLVPEVNVVGKVVFHSKWLGAGASFVMDNWPLLLFFAVVLTIFYKVVRLILRENSEEK